MRTLMLLSWRKKGDVCYAADRRKAFPLTVGGGEICSGSRGGCICEVCYYDIEGVGYCISLRSTAGKDAVDDYLPGSLDTFKL